jgi:hypothetical protein
MRPKLADAIMTGTMARPSSPSVRLTAFDDPTITSDPKRKKNPPSGKTSPLKNGNVSEVASGPCATLTSSHMAMMAMMNSKNSLTRPGTPLGEIFDTLR